jgi:hypothetical protein
MYQIGRFIWRELMSTDVHAAKEFYSALAGWSFTEHEMGHIGVYTIINIGADSIGGIMKKPDMAPACAWVGYVSVQDVDATVHTAKEAGATILVPPTDIPNTARFATFMDPTGGVIAVHRGLEEDREPIMKPGAFCWEQLGSTDVHKAIEFYGKVLGWKVFGEGFMQTFGLEAGMRGQVASVMQAPPNTPSHWVSHIAVASLDHAHSVVEKHHGKVLVGKQIVPEIGAFSVVSDPQGAVVAVFEAATPAKTS